MKASGGDEGIGRRWLGDTGSEKRGRLTKTKYARKYHDETHYFVYKFVCV